jgi:nitrate/TMAO reductase-like tetraheme cytochrome c subunit
MARISFAGFKDPARRPRYIIWALVAVLGVAAVMIAALGITSTRWFCAEGCHKVQDDTIIAYERSAHSEVSCMACHMPVSSDPITFILHKAEALGELYLTVTGNFELPLNGESHVALTMPSEQCNQCHNLERRPVTPSPGIIIDHEVHAAENVNCTLCHNRVAHVEDFELTLTDPTTGEPNQPHAQFMEMTACFRCHSLGETPEGGLTAPGTCSACHTEGFELKPPSHFEEGFFPEGHARLAAEEATRVAQFEQHEADEGEHAAAERSHGDAGAVGESLISVEALNECYTCHAEQFCSDCHGLPMPHPADFMETHGEVGKEAPEVCANCHGNADRFCDECHHGSAMGVEYTAGDQWRTKHPATVTQTGASACFECHNPTYCAACHVRGGNL